MMLHQNYFPYWPISLPPHNAFHVNSQTRAWESAITSRAPSFSIESILRPTFSEERRTMRPYTAKREERHSKTPYSTNSLLNQREERVSNAPKSKGKRVRTIFTPDQLEQLERKFATQQYMVGPERSYLARHLGLSEAQVKVWFQNRRIKWRKQHIDSKKYPCHVDSDSNSDIQTLSNPVSPVDTDKSHKTDSSDIDLPVQSKSQSLSPVSPHRSPSYS